MKKYTKIIFLCTSNTYLSPMAETLYRQFTEEKKDMPLSCSRGLVVLFPEPISPKVNVALVQHCRQKSDHEHSSQLHQKDITSETLILTMTFSEKVTVLEQYETEHENVFTIGEFVGENTDIIDPYGGEDDLYEKCFDDIARRVHKVIYKIKEKEGEKI